MSFSGDRFRTGGHLWTHAATNLPNITLPTGPSATSQAAHPLQKHGLRNRRMRAVRSSSLPKGVRWKAQGESELIQTLRHLFKHHPEAEVCQGRRREHVRSVRVADVAADVGANVDAGSGLPILPRPAGTPGAVLECERCSLRKNIEKSARDVLGPVRQQRRARELTLARSSPSPGLRV